MTKLRWNGGHFTDGGRGFRTTGTSEHEFEDDERVDEYLNHRSGDWERVDGDDSGDSDDIEEADVTDEPPASEAPEEEDVQEAESDEESVAEDVTPEEIANSDDWRWAKDVVDSGAVDDVLDEVEAAEKDRKNGPRDSVLGSIEDRREE